VLFSLAGASEEVRTIFWLVGLLEEDDSTGKEETLEEAMSLEETTSLDETRLLEESALLDSTTEVNDSELRLVSDVPLTQAVSITNETRINGKARLFIVEPPAPHHTQTEGPCRDESSHFSNPFKDLGTTYVRLVYTNLA